MFEMDLTLPEGVEANFAAAPVVGELGVVTFARRIAAYLHHLQRTPEAAHYREDGPNSLTTHLTYRLGGHIAEVTVRRGALELVVDGNPVELPLNPRDPDWAVAWAVHLHLDDQEAMERSSRDAGPAAAAG
jgi:hypothetical protein